MDVSVIIVNYNTGDLIQRCVDSVLRQTDCQFEVIVVDNASQDNSLDVLQSYDDRIKLIANAKNVGFGKANNQAFAVSTGKFIFLLNPDATLKKENTLSAFLDYMGSHLSCGVVGPVVTKNHNPTEPQYVYPGQHHLKKELEALPGEIAWIIGASMFIRREVYEKVAGFDEDYFLYGEEADLCLRVRRAGWSIGYAKNIRVDHIGGASERKSSIRDYWLKKQAGIILFYKKNYEHAEAVRLIERDLKLSRRKLLVLKFVQDPKKQERYQAILDACKLALNS